MFSRFDLECFDDELFIDWRCVRPYPGLHYQVYPQHAFRVPDSEQHVRITRAPKEPGDNGIRFWVSAEVAEQANAPLATHLIPYITGAQFRAVSESEFNRLVAGQCSELLAPPTLPLHSSRGFVGAVAMYTLDTAFIVSLVAEYDDEFVHFYWETTA